MRTVLVRVRSPSLEVFLRDFSRRISDTEMFLPTETFPPADSPVRLDLRVGTDWKLIQGRGRVGRVRRKGTGPEEPAGFGVEFGALEPQSRKLLRWIVEDRKVSEAQGERPPAPASPESEITVAETEVTEASFASWDDDDRKGLSRPVLFASLLMLILAVLAGASLLWLERGADPDDSAELRSAPVRPILPKPAAEPEPAETTASAESVTARVTEALELWAAAWREQRAADYLAAYGGGFVPPDGMSRAQWEAWRIEKIEEPSFVDLEISDLEIDEVDEWGAVATFRQTYRSDNYRDEVMKEVRLILQEGSWLILEERVLERL